MNDFLTVMGQLGVESILPETDLTLEQEMNEEISTEAELDEAYAGMEYSGIVAATSQAEAMLTAMAEREIGLESNAGADPCKIYQDFGLEAVKDVVMRKAYSTIASVKALINTCISWLKQLIGIEVATKKVFSGLERKAKAMDKSLRKVARNVTEEKLKRDMPDYETALGSLRDIVAESLDTKVTITVANLKASGTSMDTADVKTMSESIGDKIEELSDKYDKGDTDEYEGNACYSHILSAVKKVQDLGKNNKSTDHIKTINDRIKELEKLRKEVDKGDASIKADKNDLSAYITATITYLTKLSNYKKKALKLYVKCADDCLTMAKGIYATLV